MGYTHYWKFKTNKGNTCKPSTIENGTEKFKNAVALFKECLKTLNGKTKKIVWDYSYCMADRFENGYKLGEKVSMTLCNGWGKRGTKPTITDTLVSFNGCEKNSHETCYISLDEGEFNFCKTARKPYDTAVCVCLLCFKHYFGNNMEIYSDGDMNGVEWQYAKEVFNSQFNN